MDAARDMVASAVRRSLLAALLLTLAAVPAASASSLPEARFGQRPGPPLLYAKPPSAPELSVERPFRARPLLVSGTDAYRRGEYLYQDYLFDDHGADTEPNDLLTAERKPGPDSFSTATGDVLYPTGGGYRNNAADLAELRVRPMPNAVVYRATLTTVVDPRLPAVGIGIDVEPGDGDPAPFVRWRNRAGLSSPGLDYFITAWHGGGEVHEYRDGTTPLPAPVSFDRRTNQVKIRVPHRLLGGDPGGATWRHFAGVGLWDSEAGAFKPVPPGMNPKPNTPASGGAEEAPAIFNLAFRFSEPQRSEPSLPDSFFEPPDLGAGTGNWYEDRQAEVLGSEPAEVREQHADVDFGRLAGGPKGFDHGPGETQARIFASGLELPEGVSKGFPEFGGRLQPYLLRVPDELPDRPAGLTFSLHSLSATYTQYEVFSPRQLRQFGDRRRNLVATPLARGPDGWYTDEAEVDFFEVWRDVANRFRLDPERVYPSGYSMGGYGTYKLGVEWPDLFARAFTTVGPPGNGIWIPPAPPEPGGQVSNTHPLLESVRWVPYKNWVAAQDQLVPIVGPLAQQRRFDRLGLRSTLETFQGDHFTLALADEWGAARDFLGNARVERRPSRVNYAFFPGADRPGLGLVHNHAYWVHGLQARDLSGDPETDPARGELNARSQAFGEGAPRTERVTGTGTAGRPSPSVIRGTRWTGIRDARRRNRLVLGLANLRRAKVDGRGAKLNGDVAEEPLRVRLESDGDGRVRLELPLPADAVARRIDGPPMPSREAGAGAVSIAAAPAPEVVLDRDGATFAVARGEREYLISTRTGGGGGGGDAPEDGGAGAGDGGSSDFSGRGAAEAGGGADETSSLGGAVGTGSGGEPLPFTGLALGIIAALGVAAAVGGRALRRAAR